MNVTASYHLFAPSFYELAQKVQRDIYHETKIFSTVGIGPNPLLAKFSMDLEAKKTKEGIAEWGYEEVSRKLWPVEPLTKRWGNWR